MLANLSAAYLASGACPAAWATPTKPSCPTRSSAPPTASSSWPWATTGSSPGSARSPGSGSLAADPRYARNPGRVAHREELVATIAGRLATRPAAEWLAALEAAQVPCGPINDLAQVFADPQVIHRGMVATLAHPGAGEVRVVANPVRFSATPARSQRAPPRLGEHTGEILGELLGLEAAGLEDLRARKVI